MRQPPTLAMSIIRIFAFIFPIKSANEFINSKDVTKKRMYLETIESIFPGIELYIDAGNGSMEKLMIVGEETSNKEAASAVVGG